MIEEHLSEIRSREEDAGRRIREAEARAAADLETAREAGERRLDQVRAAAAEHAAELIAGAKRRAGDTIETMRTEQKNALSALENAAAENEDRALKTITDSFRDTL